MLTRSKQYAVEVQNLVKIAEDKPETPTNFLADIMKNLNPLLVDNPLKVFREEDLQKAVDRVDYGVLAALEGTWVSYNANPSKWLGSGIHASIMPSPGTTPDNIPGKFAFVSEEYIEKLTFTKVPGGIRNRGGATELFCRALKYEQSIKSVAKQNEKLQYVPIHEENGMYLWLSDVYNHPATKETIERDRGIHKIHQQQKDDYGVTAEYRDEPWVKLEDKVEGKDVYIPYSKLKEGQKYTDVLPQQELKPGDGIRGPHFIPDYSISRSGVIPHGSTVTLLGNIKADGGQLLIKGKPPHFETGTDAWLKGGNYLTVSPTMGGPGSTTPINLDSPVSEYKDNWVLKELNDENDDGSNLIYVQRIFAHTLYPYTVRPDLRLRDSLTADSDKGQKIKDYVKVNMFTQNPVGAQGGIINVPFVKRFVTTIDTTFDLYIETVIENGKEVLQLQYVQVVHFEFHFGNSGGTTSWPHIQVNTLRKLEDVPEAQRKVIEEQFKDHLTTKEKDQQEQYKTGKL